jgi:hypothetical protein
MMLRRVTHNGSTILMKHRFAGGVRHHISCPLCLLYGYHLLLLSLNILRPSGWQLGVRGSPLIHVVEVDDDLAGLVIQLASNLLVVIVHRCLISHTWLLLLVRCLRQDLRLL